MLKECPKTGVIWVSEQARKDILWWNKFCESYNGVSALPSENWFKPDIIFSSDSCLTGCRAMSDTHFFYFEIPETIIKQGKYVNQFETYAVLIAVREWKEEFVNKNIQIFCDNSSTVDILKSGRASCPFMQSCLIEIRYYSAQFKFRIRAVHLSGVDNRLSDTLSRWHLHPSYEQIFLRETEGKGLQETTVLDFELRDYW